MRIPDYYSWQVASHLLSPGTPGEAVALSPHPASPRPGGVMETAVG